MSEDAPVILEESGFPDDAMLGEKAATILLPEGGIAGETYHQPATEEITPPASEEVWSAMSPEKRPLPSSLVMPWLMAP